MNCMILAGVPGSGKTTIAKMAPGHQVNIFSADDYFMVNGEYKFDANRLGDAHALCLRTFTWSIQAMVEGRQLVVDNTNTTLVEIAPYMALARAYGWITEVTVVKCDAEVAHRRCIHGVPLNSIKRMEKNIELMLQQWPKFWPKPIVVNNTANEEA